MREKPVNLGLALQNAMRAIEMANPETLYGIFGDTNWSNKERLPDRLLRDLIEHFSKLPLEVSGSSILVRRSYVAKNPDITLKFLKAWIEGAYLFKAKPELSIGVLKKYVATQDSEVLNAIYEQQKERLSTKPTPYVRVVKSMMYLLSRTRPEVPSASPEGFAEARFINELESVGFFDEMNRQYGK